MAYDKYDAMSEVGSRDQSPIPFRCKSRLIVLKQTDLFEKIARNKTPIILTASDVNHIENALTDKNFVSKIISDFNYQHVIESLESLSK